MNKLIFLITIVFFISTNTKMGKVVLINGTSSAGKTTLLNEFHKLNLDYIVLKVDDWFPQRWIDLAKQLGWDKNSNIDSWDFLHNFLTKRTGKYYFDVELRKHLFNHTDFYQQAKNLALSGKNVIIDTVLEYEKEYINFSSVFNNYPVIKILLYCPLHTILERVDQRNKSGDIAEYRTSFQTFNQFKNMYEIKENNQQTIDITKSYLMKESLNTSIDDFIASKIPEVYYPKLERFKNKFVNKFKLDLLGEISLSPKYYSYDLVLNSGNNNSSKLAHELNNYLNNYID